MQEFCGTRSDKFTFFFLIGTRISSDSTKFLGESLAILEEILSINRLMIVITFVRIFWYNVREHFSIPNELDMTWM